MGSCLTSTSGLEQVTTEEKEVVSTYEDRKNDQQTLKLLFLGTGNSGKSTFFKQLIQIHGDGFTEKNFEDARKSVYDSILTQCKFIIQQTRELEYSIENETVKAIEFIEKLPRDIEINSEISENIKILWKDESIKKAFENRNNLSIVDSTPYFLNSIDRIGKKDYKPTENDILLVRTPTTGVTDTTFTIDGRTIRIFDVGGQRSERSKWIHVFDTVSGVLFIASLSCYDQCLFEDVDILAMNESLELFDEVVNIRWFKNSSMILILNKMDLFKQKVKRKSINVCFPEYKDKEDENRYEDSINYIIEQYKMRSDFDSNEKPIYTHITCATDRNDVKKLMYGAVHHLATTVILKGNLL